MKNLTLSMNIVKKKKKKWKKRFENRKINLKSKPSGMKEITRS